jgi:hypothetical protein
VPRNDSQAADEGDWADRVRSHRDDADRTAHVEQPYTIAENDAEAAGSSRLRIFGWLRMRSGPCGAMAARDCSSNPSARAPGEPNYVLCRV